MLNFIKSSRYLVTRGALELTNIHGKYWHLIPRLVFGASEVRARTGTFITPWSAPSGKEFILPNLEFVNDRFADICDSRAIELIQLSIRQNKKLAIMWSGGIDSTVVLSAFIKHLSPIELNNIVIFLSTESIIENPEFYKRFIFNKIRCESIYNLDVTDNFLNEYILLHGDPGDCIFGPSLGTYENLITDGKHRLSWHNNRPLIVKGLISSISVPLDIDFVEGFSHWYVDKISENLLEVNPPGIESIADWWWWHYFNFKWAFSIYRPLFRYRTDHSMALSTVNIESYITNTFYNTQKFQLWSYGNLKTHIGTNKKDHKMSAKHYIFDLDQNMDYYTNKTKMSSVPQNNVTTELKKLPTCYDQSWKGHNSLELNEMVIELLENYKG